MGFNVGKISSFASGLSSKIDTSSIIGNINIGSIKDPGAIQGIGSAISNKLNGLSSGLTGDLSSVISEGDLESATKNFDIEGKVNTMLASQGLNGSSVNIDENQINSMINDMVKQSISDIGLDSINYG